MKPFDLAKFREAVVAGRIEWRKHVLQRLAERSILQRVAVEVLRTGDRIEQYAGDRPFPSALFLGYNAGKPYHVVAAFDEANTQVYVITAYEPSLDVFEPDYRTRRK
ncbi:MAG: DUF4258 domain-containing protein [Planctomycetota bacterium]|nr:DUF4258 domain-containing protein [Planctomycetota bacterium]MDA1137504.1 DUF4258 domain-containing protein [Planctomycetota bacterium]